MPAPLESPGPAEMEQLSDNSWVMVAEWSATRDEWEAPRQPSPPPQERPPQPLPPPANKESLPDVGALPPPPFAASKPIEALKEIKPRSSGRGWASTWGPPLALVLARGAPRVRNGTHCSQLPPMGVGALGVDGGAQHRRGQARRCHGRHLGPARRRRQHPAAALLERAQRHALPPLLRLTRCATIRPARSAPACAAEYLREVVGGCRGCFCFLTGWSCQVFPLVVVRCARAAHAHEGAIEQPTPRRVYPCGLRLLPV